MHELSFSSERVGIRHWILTHPRTALGGVGVVMLTAIAIALGSLTSRTVRRMRVIEERAEQLSAFEQVRVSLQRRLFEDLGPTLPWNHFLVQELRIQVGQALALGDRLDPLARSRLETLDARLGGGRFVSRETLLDAVDLLGFMIQAESDTQARLMQAIGEDGTREFRWMLGGLVALSLLSGFGAWLIPIALIRPLESVVHSASKTLLEQHQSLARAERLAAVGETAAGVAHELHNPLAGVTLGLENLMREQGESEIAGRVQPMVEELERMGRILKDYLAAARTQPEAAVEIELAALVTDLFGLLELQIPSGIKLKNAVPNHLTCVLPRDRVRQVLLNLVLNASQAMDSGSGTVTVSASRENGELTIAVFDTGPGFSESILAEGVRPFSSGRERGTGLGLVLVRRTAADLGGRMEIGNVEDGGGQVSLNLPCSTLDTSADS
jgi:C4-dicarboxylate-specific signal transduction histidine kinase